VLLLLSTLPPLKEVLNPEKELSDALLDSMMQSLSHSNPCCVLLRAVLSDAVEELKM